MKKIKSFLLLAMAALALGVTSCAKAIPDIEGTKLSVTLAGARTAFPDITEDMLTNIVLAGSNGSQTLYWAKGTSQSATAITSGGWDYADITDNEFCIDVPVGTWNFTLTADVTSAASAKTHLKGTLNNKLIRAGQNDLYFQLFVQEYGQTSGDGDIGVAGENLTGVVLLYNDAAGKIEPTNTKAYLIENDPALTRADIEKNGTAVTLTDIPVADITADKELAAKYPNATAGVSIQEADVKAGNYLALFEFFDNETEPNLLATYTVLVIVADDLVSNSVDYIDNLDEIYEIEYWYCVDEIWTPVASENYTRLGAKTHKLLDGAGIAAVTAKNYQFDGWYEIEDRKGKDDTGAWGKWDKTELDTNVGFSIASVPFGVDNDADDLLEMPANSTGNIAVASKWVKDSFVKTETTEVIGDDDEGAFPKGRTVKVNSFYICKQEVTQKEFEDVMGELPSYVLNPKDWSKEEEKNVGDDVAAYYISWYDAVAYCNLLSIKEGKTPCYKIKDASGKYTTDPKEWVDYQNDNAGVIPTKVDANWDNIVWNWEDDPDGYRLPTEVEWEFAARGGDPTASDWDYKYAGSDSIGSVANYAENTPNTVNTVTANGSATKIGTYDQSGNVWEWCWDWYVGDVSDQYYYTTVEGKKHEVLITERGPSEQVDGAGRVQRGGSFTDDEVNGDGKSYCSVKYRDNYGNHKKLEQEGLEADIDNGFRVVTAPSAYTSSK